MGGSKTVVQSAPPAPTATQSAQDVLNAQLATNPRAAQQAFEIATNPQYGIEPFTRAIEQARTNVLPQEAAVRDQLLSNVLANLISPTGITPEQQSGIDLRRGQAQDELVRSLRTRANLGGGLFGGRAGLTEERAVRDLQAGFAEEDIAREERARLNAIQAALPALSVLFPEIGITAPQFTSPAPSGNAALSAASASRGQDIQQAIAEAQMRSALQSSLFGGLGQAAGGLAQGIGTAGSIASFFCWVAAEIFGGWNHPKTVLARFYVTYYSPKWFKDFYGKHGKAIAEFISDKPILKIILRPLFEAFALCGATFNNLLTR